MLTPSFTCVAAVTRLGPVVWIPRLAAAQCKSAGAICACPRRYDGRGEEHQGTMDEQIRTALETDRAIDITTIGRRSGQPRRIEMAFHNLDGQIYITGTPGKRDWYANLVANPDFTFHLKRSATADLPAHATPITDP